jgi:hypothetical protein
MRPKLNMTASALDRGTAAAALDRAQPDAASDPRTRRFLINPGVLGLEVHPTLSGRSRAEIPYGFAVRFDTFNGMSVPNWSVDPEDHSPPDKQVDLTAREAVENVMRAAWQGSRDMGARTLDALTPLTDDAAHGLLARVFPAMTDEYCPYGDENTEDVRFEHRAIGANGEPVAEVVTVSMFRCVTCALAHFRSDECEAQTVGDPVAERLRKELIDAYQTNQSFFRAKWNEWTAEMQRRDKGENGISVLTEAHEHVMRQLHEAQPADKQAALLRESQATQADNFREGIRELANEMRSTAPAPTLNLDELKRQLLDDPAFRKQLAEEAARQEQDKKSGGGKVK